VEAYKSNFDSIPTEIAKRDLQERERKERSGAIVQWMVRIIFGFLGFILGLVL
jgi:hypothetical protein